MANKIDFVSLEEELRNIFSNAAKAELERLKKEGPKYVVCGCELLDLCGNAFVKFKDGRSSFCRQLKAYNKERGQEGFLDGLSLEYGHTGRQEFSVNKAGVQAVVDYLREHFKVKCYCYSYID